MSTQGDIDYLRKRIRALNDEPPLKTILAFDEDLEDVQRYLVPRYADLLNRIGNLEEQLPEGLPAWVDSTTYNQLMNESDKVIQCYHEMRKTFMVLQIKAAALRTEIDAWSKGTKMVEWYWDFRKTLMALQRKVTRIVTELQTYRENNNPDSIDLMLDNLEVPLDQIEQMLYYVELTIVRFRRRYGIE